jgi:hypothetical protein
MCRLETRHRDELSHQDFLNKALSSPDFGWNGRMFFSVVRTENSGEVVAVAYLERPGYTAPYVQTTE